MPRKGQEVTVLYATEGLLAAMPARWTGKGVEVSDWHVARGPWSQDGGTFQQALQDFVARNNLAEDRVVSVLPRHEITVRILELPSQDEAEIAGMLELGAEEYVPYDLEDLVIDQCVLAELPDGHSRVLAVFAQKRVVERHLEVLREAGVEPTEVLLSTACLAAAGSFVVPPDETVVVTHVAPDGLEAVVFRDGVVRYARGVGHGEGVNLAASSEDELLEELAVELRTTLTTYRRESEDGLPPDRLWLCADWRALDDIVGALGERLSVPCEQAPWSGLKIEAPESVAGVAPLVMAGGALAAFDQTPAAVSLLPEATVSERQQAKVQRTVIRAGILAAVLLFGLGVAFGVRSYQQRVYIAELRDRIAQLEPTVQGVVVKQQQLATLQRQVERTGTILEILARFTEVAPDEGLNVTRFAYRHEDGITIEGRAMELAQVQQLTDEMRAIGQNALALFARTKEIYTQDARERHKAVKEYSIEARFQEEEEES